MTDLFIPVFFLFMFFVICSLCGFCCRKNEQGAIYSTPVVVTSQTHHPVGGVPAQTYQINPQSYNQQFTTTTVHQLPSPYNTNMTHPIQQHTFVVPQAPYAPQQPAMYPPAPAMARQDSLPPPYHEVTNTQLYPKQQPFNPNFQS